MKKLAGVLGLLSIIAAGIGIYFIVATMATSDTPTWPSHRGARRAFSQAEVKEGLATKKDFEPTQHFTLPIDGIEREFIVYRPKQILADTAVPVVFMFHGGGGTGEQFYKMSGWKEKADQEGFMVVFPTALKYHLYADEKVDNGRIQTNVTEFETRWNTYQLPQTFDSQYPNQQPADDLAFTRAIVEFVQDNYAVDTLRLYACGFSNGGNFSNRLMLEASDLFAAYCVSSAGSLNDLVESAPDSGYTPRSVISILGSIDPKFRYSSQVGSFPIDESAMDEGSPTRTRFIDGYLSVLELSDEYTYENTGKAGHFIFQDPLTSASAGLEYQFYVVKNMEHVFPNGKNFPLTAADVYWDFFKRYSR